MKNINTILAVGTVAAVCGAAEAAIVAAWDFQTTTNGGTAIAAAPAISKSFVANFGSGTLFLDGTNGSSNYFVPASGTNNTELNAFGGTSVNADTSIGMSTVTSGVGALAVVGGAGNAANGKSMVFKFSMAGFSNLSVSYATQRSSTGFTSQVLEYSVDGVNWSSIGANTSIQSSFSALSNPPGVATVFSGISGLDGAAVAYVRMTLTGATNPSGNNRFDNFVFSADNVPAPGAMALLGVAGLLGTRRRR
jgi:MYXO-CTERM domain-containing protein